MTAFLLLGTLFSLAYFAVTRWMFPGVTAGMAWYIGYFACYGLAAVIALRRPANSATETLIVALKALLPTSGAIMIVYGCFIQFASSTPVGDADVLDTTSTMTGPLCIVAGVALLLISLWMLRKDA